MSQPFAYSGGSKSAKIALVGEAWGKQEAILKYPLVGQSGYLLAQMLHQAGIVPDCPKFDFQVSNAMMRAWWRKQNIFTTNVFALRPEDNKIDNLCAKKAEVQEEMEEIYGSNTSYPYNQLSSGGKYIRPQYFHEVERLKLELSEVQPNITICLGGTALWALAGNGSISKLRGAVAPSSLVDGLKILPTFHPASVMRQWQQYTIVIADLMKAKRESEYKEIKRPKRWVLVNPTIEEVENYINEMISSNPPLVGCDIETYKSQVEMISLSPSVDSALIVPFVNRDLYRDDSGWHSVRPGFNYWNTKEEEIRAWAAVQRFLASKVNKLWQNGAAFDLVRLRKIGLKISHNEHDTMLLSHSIYPEMQKGLGFLGSIHTDEASWKLMRIRGHEDLKREE